MTLMNFKRFLVLWVILFGFCAEAFGEGLYGPENDMTPLENRLELALKVAETQPEKARKEAEEILAGLTPRDENYKADAWVILSKALLYQGDNDEAMQWAEKASAFAAERGDLYKELLGDYAKILVFRNSGDLEAEKALGKKSLKRAEEAGYDYLSMVHANVLGASYTRLSEFDSAILCFQKALDYSKKLNSSEDEAKMLNNLASVFIAMKNLPEALEYMDKGIELAGKSGDKGNLVVLLVNKAYIFDELGRLEEQTGILERALTLAREVGSVRLEGAVIANLADLILQQGDYKKAAELAKRSYEISDEMGDSYQQRVSRVTYGQALSHLGSQKEALEIFKDALKGFQDDEMEAEVIEVTRIIASSHEQAGNYKEALAFHKAYKEKSDALFQSEKQKMATELNAKYESEQKEKEILLLNKDNQIKTEELRLKQYQRNIVLIIAASVLLAALLIFQRLYASRKTNSRLEELNKKLNELSLKDTLTGLYNRRYFHSHIQSHLSYAMRFREDKDANTGKVGFLILDVDHFKRVNDQEGHHTGDMVLKELGERLTELLRGSDIVVRWGGEEFLIAVRDSTMEGIKQLAERILQRVGSEPFSFEDKAVSITCSVGYCCFPFFSKNGTLDWEKVVQLADLALYRAKETGRNRAIGVLPAEDPVSEDKIETILNQFDQALEENLIRLC